jgi:hypothetical protein
MFYEQHKTIRFVAIQRTRKTGIVSKTSLPICINPLRILAVRLHITEGAAHKWVTHSTLSVTNGLFD